MKLKLKSIAILIIFLITSCNKEIADTYEDRIWYTAPASEWNDALPVGNGRLGAMVFGIPGLERIQLNEDSMWPGGPEWGNSKGTPEDLTLLRNLMNAGDLELADSLIVEKFSNKWVTRSHQTMGDLWIQYPEGEVTDYRRSLNLDRALVISEYKLDGFQTSQHVFASAPDDALVISIASENPEGISIELQLSRPDDKGHPTVKVHADENGSIIMDGMVTQFGGQLNSTPAPLDHGVAFQTVLKINGLDGKYEVKGNNLILSGVKKLSLVLVCNTSFYTPDFKSRTEGQIAKLDKLSLEKLYRNHLKDYSSLYNRVNLDLGGQDLDSIPTDQRLAQIKNGKLDPDFIAKLFQYGRYLLISSSRPGTNPANLQGIWNEHIEAPWNADYHLNINLQMNYWPAEVTNLSELHMPLFDLSDRLIERGKVLAKEQYNMNGAIAHHTTDLWVAPWMQAARSQWGSWIHGGPWLAQHYWEHFRFTKDTTFLKDRALPAFSAYAAFYCDWLVEDPLTHEYYATPDTSPENEYLTARGNPVAVANGTAMGHQIIAEIFDNYLATTDILNIENDLTNEVREKRKRLRPGIRIGSDGRILEWDQEYPEPEKGHRHISHLYGLYPGDDISIDQKDLFNAAEKTIHFRLDNGGAGPGWSRAWIINFFARLQDKPAVAENIQLFLQRSIFSNMLDIHPPFQIDGNFGFTAGIAEMLLQSHDGFLRILPALPENLPQGSISGLKARGNITVDIAWADNKLTSLILLSESHQSISIKYGNTVKKIELEKNKPLTFNGQLETN
ncbi:glycoside hydrolase family 95 protein [Robertkochia solimangrovi]|uniref:glycoside hydrolase family 95 protein n=1 Tax=Robertkochia solimangrovi TaxID=2213046 RepID=UPI00117CED69|nr:glycoside hydrolase family 95 protein [Robertkochia solimangrovi]TRZ42302.1 glycoside hydrolase family 95 protein [Robertkochia solimangrovi]